MLRREDGCAMCTPWEKAPPAVVVVLCQLTLSRIAVRIANGVVSGIDKSCDMLTPRADDGTVGENDNKRTDQ
jgi:hypothetical protein